MNSTSTLMPAIYQQYNNIEHLNIGGIVGALWKGSTLNQCFNTGKIYGALTCQIEKYVCAAGIVGECFGNVENCYNKGDVSAGNTDSTSGQAFGGLVGSMQPTGTLKNSYNTSLNIGRIPLYQNYKAQYKGLVCGANEGTISNVYYLPQTSTSTVYATAGIGGGSAMSGTTQKTSAQLQGLASTLGSTYWVQSSSINGGFPYLKNNQP